jgi:hypothetical protein
MERGGFALEVEKYYRNTGADIWKKPKRRNRGWNVCSDG